MSGTIGDWVHFVRGNNNYSARKSLCPTTILCYHGNSGPDSLSWATLLYVHVDNKQTSRILQQDDQSGRPRGQWKGTYGKLPKCKDQATSRAVPLPYVAVAVWDKELDSDDLAVIGKLHASICPDTAPTSEFNDVIEIYTQSCK